MFDVIVVGGGPAGLSAALCLGRARRSTLLVDAGEGRNAPASEVHNLFAHDGTPPAELRRRGRKELEHYPTVRTADTTVTEVSVEEDGTFRLTLAGERVERSRRLLLATGLADRLPQIDGVDALWGRSAFHCPYCHGYEISDRQVAVIGGEPERVRLALHLSRFTKDVVLCTNGPVDLPPLLRGALDRAAVPIRDEAIARLDGRGDQIEAIVFASGATLPRDAVFIKTVLHQRSSLPAELGCAMFDDGCVEVNEFGQTNVPGVSAAGDMARRATVPVPLAAVIAAAASGTVAATLIDQELISEDFGLPNPFAVRKE